MKKYKIFLIVLLISIIILPLKTKALTEISDSNNNYVYKNGQAILFNNKNLSEYNWLFSSNAGFGDRLILLPKEWDQIETSGNGTVLSYSEGLVYSYNADNNTWIYKGKSTSYGPFVCYPSDSNIYSTTIDCYYKFGDTKKLLAARGFGIPNYERSFDIRFEDLENNLINFITITNGVIDLDQKEFLKNDLAKVGFITEYYKDINCTIPFDFDETITDNITIYVKYTKEVEQNEIDFLNMITYNFDKSKDYAIISNTNNNDILFAIDYKFFGFELHKFDTTNNEYIKGESTCPTYEKQVGKWYIYRIPYTEIGKNEVLVLSKQQLIERKEEKKFLSIIITNKEHFVFGLSNNAIINYTNDLKNAIIYNRETLTEEETDLTNVNGGLIKKNDKSIINDYKNEMNKNFDKNVFNNSLTLWNILESTKINIYFSILCFSSIIWFIIKSGVRK